MAVVLIGGGARSGKSRQALELARQRGGRLTFLATAQPNDADMEIRIARHRAERGGDFATIEEPIDVAGVIQRMTDGDVIVIDCLTLWLSNVMLTFGRDTDADTEAVLDAARKSSAHIIFVTNEVGCGIVPENTLGRDFRDRAGILNQRIAEAAQEVHWMVFGCPLRVK